MQKHIPIIITEATIRDALQLDDAESIDCLPNEEIFTELSRMGYEKPSTKLTFYKAFFSPQWKFLIHTILQCMSAKRTLWNEFSSSMNSAVICLSTGRKFNFSKAQVDDLSSHFTKYSSHALTQKVFANMRRVGKRFSRVDTPLFKGMIMAQPDDDIADEGVASVAIDNVPAAVDEPSIPLPTPTTPPSQDLPSTSQDKITQALEITKLKQKVKKLERRNKLKVSKLRILERVGTAQRVDTSDDTVMDDVSKQGRIIPNMDADMDVTLKDVADIAKEVVVDTEIKESADVQGRQPESQAQIYQIDLEHADKDDEIDQVQRKEKEDNAVMRNIAGFKMDYFKEMKYDNIHPIFEKYFNSNVAFLEKTREQMEEEDSKALKRKSESQAEKAAKKQKLDEEVEELKKHLQIVPNDEDDPKNFSDDILLTTLTYMFEKPDVQAQVWKNQRTIHDLAKVKSWRLLELCGVHIITFTTTQMILLVERRYPLTRFTLDQMLNNVRLEVEEESEVSLELLRFVGNNNKKDLDQSSVWIHPLKSRQRSNYLNKEET
nr:hypothetical protein [Tanacetum cinerariifolium]